MIEKFKKRLPVLTVLLILLVLAGVLGGRYLSNEYHTYHSKSVREYEPISEDHGSWRLTTERKELLGKVYAAFTVWDLESGKALYRCPDLYPVSELISIHWDSSGDDIIVESSYEGMVRYQKKQNIWEKME